MATNKNNTTKNAPKAKAPKNTNPKRHCIDTKSPASEYLTNGGTVQVLARAFMVASKGNAAVASAKLASAISAKQAETFAVEAGNYCRWASKDANADKAQAHRTFDAALTLAKAAK